ncbi:MFS transporter [Bacillus safensis]|uniref:CynX/NimT family MFS transporter n=1 Tax=Bacillus TaxID=1386 RepID=UPI000D036258|nr:MFS transporter [Bacillus safensis]MCM3137608.1 MFS transporter [Bacillus safensis]MEE3676283.1 MFS transporter [Bacillus safensis]PRS24767.1 MFS transporter [Bacillus safensis]UXC33610.1 MFS transporter [Bacillus safensis]
MRIPQTEQEQRSSMQTKKRILTVVGVILIAANLRAPITAVGPVLSSIRDNLEISNTLAGTIPTAVLFTFALFSPFAPKITRHFSIESTLFMAITLLLVGIGIRSVGRVDTLFLGTIIIGSSIAVCNVLLPSFIKHQFAKKLGFMTGVYAVSMNLFGAIGSGISVPISSSLGFEWSGSLSCWGFLTLLTMIFWIPQLKNNPESVDFFQKENKKNSISLWRSKIAWNVTLFMGTQSFIFFTVISWLPEILETKGLNTNEGGWMLSLMQLSMLPATFIVPILAGHFSKQQILVLISFLLLVVGLLGILFGVSFFIPLWIIMIGIGIGMAFSLAMMFFSLRTKNIQEAAELSGMAQSLGYLLAAIGPILFGWLHDVTYHWTVPLLMLIFISVIILITGVNSGKNIYVTSAK